MSLYHDPVTGWITHEGVPRWRATQAAVDRIAGQGIEWLDRPACAHVAHLSSGVAVAVIRCYPRIKKHSVKMEGFTFWTYDRILQREHFSTVQGFDRLRDARKFVNTILKQVNGNRVTLTVLVEIG